jgi:hypothetical protein
MQLTQGKPFVVERVRITGNDIFLEGRFTLPESAWLNSEDRIFITDFIRCHESIKEMERTIGVSRAMIKSRLNQIAGSVPIVCCTWWRPRQGDFAQLINVYAGGDAAGLLVPAEVVPEEVAPVLGASIPSAAPGET